MNGTGAKDITMADGGHAPHEVSSRDNRPLHARLARQALARPLSETEQALARALESIFATGTHDFTAVAAALEAKHVAKPSGASAPWTTALLEQELKAINASLDAAYATDGIGA